MDYRFSASSTTYELGEVHAKLRATQRKVDNFRSIAGSPYELILWFTLDGKVAGGPCSVLIPNISLRKVGSDTKVFSDRLVEQEYEKRSSGETNAYFHFNDVQLEYIEHILDLEYKIHGLCAITDTESTISFTFNEDYEEREITFWDTLMGI